MSVQPTLAAIAVQHVVLSPGTSCAVVDELFQSDPDCSSALVAYEDDDRVLLVNRHAFFQMMTGRRGYGRTLHYRNPVNRVLAAPQVQVLTAGMTLEDAAFVVLNAGTQPQDDLLVRLEHGWGTVATAHLHQHLARLHRGRATEVARGRDHLARLVEHAVDIIVVLDGSGRVKWVSRQAEGMARTNVDERGFADVLPDDDAGLVAAFEEITRQPGTQLGGDFRMRALDGEVGTFEYSARNLLHDPAVEGIVINSRDVTHRRALEEQLRHHASHDPLTGLANRKLLVERAGDALDGLRRSPGDVTVLYCDLDGFKQINDGLGHDVGDLVLVEVARRLAAEVRRGDTVARVGGDEFVVLAEACPPEEAAALAGRLVSALEAPMEIVGTRLDVSVSVGFVSTAVTTSPGTLIKQADTAMYAAKLGGRSRWVEFSAASHDRAVRTERLASDLRLALTRGQLHLVFQPILDAQQGGMAGVEALLRWTHPVLGSVSPAEFIPLAERGGLIGHIGRWVIDQACAALARWSAHGAAPAWVSVNIAAQQLDDGRLVQDVIESLHVHGLRPAHLRLELTESAIAEGVPHRLAVLAELREIGISIALDDFGTGYSSLSSIRHVPLDVLKIDRSFVADLTRSGDAVVLLRSIVDLAHSLTYRVVAEGVEQDEELRVLEDLGCDYVQGYLLGRPVPAEAFVETAAAVGSVEG